MILKGGVVTQKQFLFWTNWSKAIYMYSFIFTLVSRKEE